MKRERVTHVRFSGKVHNMIARGRIDGRPFVAVQYTDYRGGQQGAWPIRWRVRTLGGAPFTTGERSYIARELRRKDDERWRKRAQG